MREITRTLLACSLFGFMSSGATSAADLEAGKETAAVCAACHGEAGISVSDDIPNLAGQKAPYLAAQLTAFRAGERKNALMEAIAEQLSDGEIENVTAFFASLPGGSGTSDLLPELVADRVTFPKDYQQSFTRYTTISFPDRKQVRHYYANDLALEAAKADDAFPNGALLFVEIFKAKLDADGKPIEGADGHFEPAKLAAYSAMEKQAGWGDSVPELLRNGDWSYAVFGTDGVHKAGINEAKCLACHKPLTDKDYVFSLEALQDRARMPQ